MTFPGTTTFPGPTTFPGGIPSGATVTDRYREVAGDDVRAETMFYVGAMSAGAMLASALAGVVHQPRDVWALVGAAAGYAWGRRHWRRPDA